MGRRETPLDPARGVAERFAADLRAARIQAGEPPYRQLARATHFSAATLARAASGRSLPSLDVTLAYASACGATTAELAEWRERWQAARHEANDRADRPLPDETRPAPETSREPRTGHAASEDHRDAETPEQQPVATGFRHLLQRLLQRRPRVLLTRTVITVSVAANCVLLYSLVATPSRTKTTDEAAHLTVQDGTDPKPYHCSDDATNLDQVPVVLPQDATIDGRLRPTGTVLGTVTLRYSARCSGAWSRFDPAEHVFSQPNQGTVTTRSLRTNDGTYTEFHLGHIDQSYADLLLTGMGCVEAHTTVVVANGTVRADAVTQCLPRL
ncbi:DUF2690 domain-containing protein [Kitasatospora sp. NPDC127067]|uniref:helix-turn-helix domain-containing protein n=1 Tax=Kitasatospora sp. NPDC127067 TaxID=3347126 RepID=UPI0036686BD9